MKKAIYTLSLLIGTLITVIALHSCAEQSEEFVSYRIGREINEDSYFFQSSGTADVATVYDSIYYRLLKMDRHIPVADTLFSSVVSNGDYESADAKALKRFVRLKPEINQMMEKNRAQLNTIPAGSKGAFTLSGKYIMQRISVNGTFILDNVNYFFEYTGDNSQDAFSPQQ